MYRTPIRLLFIFLFLLLTSAAGYAQSPGFVVLGRVEGPGSDSLTKAVLRGLLFPLDDAVPIRQGRFVFEGRVMKPGVVLVGTDNVRPGLGMWLSNDTIRATFRVQDHGGGLHLLQPVSVEGPAASVDYLAHLNAQNQYNETHSNKQDVTQYVAELVSTYVRAHPDSPYALYLLGKRSSTIGPAISRNLLDNMTPALRNSDAGDKLLQSIETQEALILGKSVLAFSLPDQQGVRRAVVPADKPYTLLSFWSSDCGPCRVHNKELVRLHQQSNPATVRMASISLDTDNAAWRRAIQKDGLTWDQFADLKSWDSPELKQFTISAIPLTILLDKDSKIVAITDAEIQRLLNVK